MALGQRLRVLCPLCCGGGDAGVVAQADFDGNGLIDYGEFLAATIHLNKIEREETLFAAFSHFDKDKSGFITIDELQARTTAASCHQLSAAQASSQGPGESKGPSEGGCAWTWNARRALFLQGFFRHRDAVGHGSAWAAQRLAGPLGCSRPTGLTRAIT